MIVKFDSLSRFEPPKFYLCNPGSVYSGGTLSKVVGILPETNDEELVLNFNSISELNFRMYKPAVDNTDESAYIHSLYKSLQNRRMIFLDDIGYFVITSVKDGYSDNEYYKDVRAESCEVEIQNKMVPYIDNGTYQFEDLLDMISSHLPLWSIGHIDDSVSDKWRTFDDVSVDINCYSFMIDNMQDAYECIFCFDCINRVISVYDQSNYVRQTNIHITKEDMINSIEISEESDNLYTAISVQGDDDLNIAPVNPLGTNVIYNFDNYLDWMSEELRQKVVSWKEAVANVTDSYYSKNLQYYSRLTDISECNLEMSKLSTQITMYRRCRDNIVAESGTLQIDGYNTVIVSNGGSPIEVLPEIGETLAEIDRLISAAEANYDNAQQRALDIQGDIDSISDEINSIHNSVALDKYFTSISSGDVLDSHLLEELMNYIYEGSYTDEYICVTGNMSYNEKFQQMKILYDRAVTQLEKVSKPTQEFTLDVENFIFVKEFQEWSEQLETGCLINTELEDGDVAMLFLSNMTVNYADKSLKFTFGNRFNKFDPKALFDNVLGNIQKSTNTLNFVKDLLFPIKNGEFNYMREALQNSRTLTKNAVMASSNEDVVIDDTGYTGRRMVDGIPDPKQVKITGSTIAFTDDAWETCKVALGDLILGDGDRAYGINAEAILGDMIIGNQLHIVDNEGREIFSVVDNKILSSIYGDENGKNPDGTDSIYSKLTQIEQTANSVELRVGSVEENMGEVDHVTTKINRYTFDDKGLTIHIDGEEIQNLITNKGMYISKISGQSKESILTADTEGVNAINLTARQYLIVGNGSTDGSRFEQVDFGDGVKRTACFYISE